MRINGQTKLTGIIGYPLEYTLSPAMHNAAFKTLRLNWLYLPLAVKEKNLATAILGLQALGFVGVNVTMPYKEEVLKLVDELSSEAQLFQAVNTLIFKGRRIIGYNTDGQGFLESLKESGFLPKGKIALLIGAGGVAKAVAFSLAKAGLLKLYILNRTSKRAQDLKDQLASKFPKLKLKVLGFGDDLSLALEEGELLINATPLGSQENKKWPLTLNNLSQKHLVFDLIYHLEETWFLKQAKLKGAKTLGGLKMLLYQGALSFETWTGLKPPLEIMEQALKSTLPHPK